LRKIHNLALVGFMGTGKSSVGRIVAHQLQFRFLDTDEWIESQLGMSIPEIFSKLGESAFRDQERRVLETLSQEKGMVVSTGGGLIVDPANLANLRNHALVVCLWASPQTIWERVRHQTHRPLLQAPDPLARIHDLLASRAPAYHRADVLIHSGSRSPKEVAMQVMHQFQIARRPEP
jgi:shikimate kinase